jgi:hypothetical protein
VHARLIRNNLLDPEIIYEVWGRATIWYWNKYKDILLRQRELYHPDMYTQTEYLYTVMERIVRRRGHPTDTLKAPISYTEEARKKVTSEP